MQSEQRIICVCTPYGAAMEPRGPRHARALAELYPQDKIIFLDCAPQGFGRAPTPVLTELPNLHWLTVEYPTRVTSPVRWLLAKLRHFWARVWFKVTGRLVDEFFSPAMVGVRAELKKIRADVIFPHNIEMLLPAAKVARADTVVFFDCMEYYPDMGMGQSVLLQRGIRKLENKLLPKCKLITASSPEVAAAYASEHDGLSILTLYNCPPLVSEVKIGSDPSLRLYWRNSVLGLGQRGLGDVLVALKELPESITLHLQGRLGHDNGKALRYQIARLNLEHRVELLPPHGPNEAVLAAARHSVGLCLERSGNRNHELTVSNKLFDYMMGGLAVIASDLPGLRSVVERSCSGLLFKPGCPRSLRERILSLHDDQLRLAELRSNARNFAIREGNREIQMDALKTALKNLL